MSDLIAIICILFGFVCLVIMAVAVFPMQISELREPEGSYPLHRRLLPVATMGFFLSALPVLLTIFLRLYFGDDRSSDIYQFVVSEPVTMWVRIFMGLNIASGSIAWFLMYRKG